MKTIHVEFMVDRLALGQNFLRLLQFSSANYHSVNVSYSFESLRTVSFLTYETAPGSVKCIAERKEQRP